MSEHNIYQMSAENILMKHLTHVQRMRTNTEEALPWGKASVAVYKGSRYVTVKTPQPVHIDLEDFLLKYER